MLRTTLQVSRAAVVVALSLSANAAQVVLIPFFNNSYYARSEQINPPWFVRNYGAPEVLYGNGVPLSWGTETGTYDLNLPAAWAVQRTGAKVGIVDMGPHGDRVQAIVKTVALGTVVCRHELHRWYAEEVAAGIVDCVNQGCRVITLTTGFGSDVPVLYNALLYASNCVVCCSVPDQSGDLDGGMVDYPYEYRLPWVLPVTSGDRSGGQYPMAATGTNCVRAPGRNVVAAGTYGTGTSFACPIAAGVTALVMQHYPGLAPEDYVALVRRDGVLNPVASLSALVGVSDDDYL
jgi:hypothetical protein